jgi:nitrogen regulatory protein PII
MKALFISYDQAYHERIIEALTHLNCRGFTLFDQVKGRGSHSGEPHFGSHAWPSMCSAIMAVVEDDRVDSILKKLHEMDVQTEQLGLRAFVWNIEQSI